MISSGFNSILGVSKFHSEGQCVFYIYILIIKFFWIDKSYPLDRSSRPEVFCKKAVLTNFAKLTGKDLCQSLFLIKNNCVGCFCWLLWHGCFPVNLTKFIRTSYRTRPVTASALIIFKTFFFAWNDLRRSWKINRMPNQNLQWEQGGEIGGPPLKITNFPTKRTW